MRERKTYLTIILPVEKKKQLQVIASGEGRSLSNMALRLLLKALELETKQ